MWMPGSCRTGVSADLAAANIDALQSQYSTNFRAPSDITTRFGNILIESLSKLLTVVLIPIATLYILLDMNRLRSRFSISCRRHAHTTSCNSPRILAARSALPARNADSFDAVRDRCHHHLFLRRTARLRPAAGFIAGLLYAIPSSARDYALPGRRRLPGNRHPVPYTSLLLLFAWLENFVFDNVLSPRIVGGSVGLHPLTTMFSSSSAVNSSACSECSSPSACRHGSGDADPLFPVWVARFPSPSCFRRTGLR